MQRLSLALASMMVLFAASAPGQTSNNPAYQGWSTWRVGATATTRIVSDGTTPTITHTATLKSVDAEAVVVDIATTIEADGMKFSNPAAPHTYFAKAPALVPEKQGKETLTVNGKQLECDWTEISGDAGAATRTWICKDVPGGMVRETIRSEGATATTQLVEWKGEKR